MRKAIGLFLACCLALVTVALFAQQLTAPSDTRWAVRTGETSDGSHFPKHVPEAQCGSLQYFSQPNPNLFAINGRYLESQPDAVTSSRVGEVNGFAIYIVIHRFRYTFTGDVLPSYIKMILVERKPGEFCAIFKDNSDEAVMYGIEPAYLVSVDSQTVLVTRDQFSGNGGFHNQAYWTFDDDGPVFLDLAIIGDTLKKLLPDGLSMGRGSDFEIGALTFNGPVAKPGEGGCCSTGGSVRIQFAISNHQLTVVSQQFDPTPLMSPLL